MCRARAEGNLDVSATTSTRLRSTVSLCTRPGESPDVGPAPGAGYRPITRRSPETPERQQPTRGPWARRTCCRQNLLRSTSARHQGPARIQTRWLESLVLQACQVQPPAAARPEFHPTHLRVTLKRLPACLSQHGRAFGHGRRNWTTRSTGTSASGCGSELCAHGACNGRQGQGGRAESQSSCRRKRATPAPSVAPRPHCLPTTAVHHT
mmetsp:Transcript_34637/g.79767  ORF Transcript_34637/g.79767 Transcript_34637/m.79767 type:complete len:209 (-) Transcript_34637:1029-1655(-)